MPDTLDLLASRIAAESELEAFVCSFERAAMLEGRTLDAAALPPPDHPERLAIATELLRVDMELAWQRGAQRHIEDYRSLVPDVFRSPSHLACVAFEEFRLRENAGEEVDAATYLSKYQLESHLWPAPVARPPASTTVPNAAPEAFPRAGDVFDGMYLEHLIGVGAASRVYLARQPRFGDRWVVLKVSSKITVEPRYLGRLQHTNIVPVYSCHVHQGLCGLCMPFLGVTTLADRLAGVATAGHPRCIEWRQSCSIAAQLADGLQHAHESGVVHADIKPANVLMGDDGIPRLLDFHLASDAAQAGIIADTVGGTVSYMAPEHLLAVQQGTKVSPESDIFSLGVLLFEMLTARLPFPHHQGVLEQYLAAAIRERQTPPSPREFTKHIPVGVDAIVRKCLAPHASDRYAAAHQVADDLRNELTSAPLIYTREPSFSSRLQKWLRRHRGGMAKSVAVGLLLLATALLVVWWRREVRLADRTALAQFRTAVQEARASLAIQHSDADLVELGERNVVAALNAMNIRVEGPWRPSRRFGRLADNERREVATSIGELQRLATGARLGITALDTFEPSSLAPKADLEFPAAVVHELMADFRFADAVDELEEGIRQSSHDMVLWIQLGVCQLALGMNETALESLTAAIALQPESSIPWRYRGYARLEQQDHQQALADFDRALSLSPQSVGLHLNRAIALYELQRLEEAERAASQAIDGRVDRPRAWLLRARIREQLGDLSGAEDDRKLAVASKPLDDEDWGALAVCVAKNDPQAACALVEDGLQAFPNSVVLLRNKVHLLGDVLDRPKVALEAAEAILAARPDDVPAKLSLAVLLARRGSFDEAVHLCRDTDPTRLRPVDHLQIACVHALTAGEVAGGTDQALMHVRKALAADPRLAARAANDPDLRELRDEVAFRQIIAAAAVLLRPDPTATR